ncbi:hypothetical protein BUALT_BualtUnG0000100 [Buddleja alternifolia]|uniref:Transposase MuDR plant domain-containing protein n=1 Tax=Buddleja alternifolia TaxID=168488 RepID=A0AAV6W7V2_9LAMI|nr:hypothetical protein BUALT_BualtUnG0000100 [Buddleja alternifolia]
MVFRRLGTEPDEKVVHFSVKYAPNQLTLLKDQAGLDTLMELNDKFAHIYVSSTRDIHAYTSSNAQNNKCLPSTIQGTQPTKNESNGALSTDMVSYGDRLIPHACSVWDDIIVGEGQAFENAEAFRLAIYKYSIAHRFSYKFNHNRARYMSIQCVMEGCPWKISAGHDGGSKSVSIKKFNNFHSHSPADLINFKPRFSSKLMGDIVSDKISSNYSYLPKQNYHDVWGDHQLKMSYHQAWATKERAKQMLDGNVEDSYRVVIISDRNRAIISVINELFSSENHAYFYRHVKENFGAYINRNPHFKLQSAAKARALKNLDDIAYARTIEKYSHALVRMKNFHPYLYDWVVANGPEHWSNALFLKPRWDRMNANPAESFNAWMGEDRFLPIGKMMQAHCKNYARLLLNKVDDMHNWKIPVGNRIEKKIIENQSF